MYISVHKNINKMNLNEDLIKRYALDMLESALFPVDLERGSGRFHMTIDNKEYIVDAVKIKEADGVSNEKWEVRPTLVKSS